MCSRVPSISTVSTSECPLINIRALEGTTKVSREADVLSICILLSKEIKSCWELEKAFQSELPNVGAAAAINWLVLGLKQQLP